MPELNANQRLFVAEYLVDGNATRAAEAAGYSKRTAKQQGSRLLTNVYVKAAVEAGLKKREKKLAFTAERLDRELAAICFLDPGKAFDEDNNLVSLKDMPRNVRRAVASVEVEERWSGKGEDAAPYLVKKVKFNDKLGAIRTANQLLGRLKEKVEHEVKFSAAEILAEAWRRKQGGKQ